MSESILVTGKKISSMELVTNVTGNEKIPTGQQDDLAITPNQIADYTITRGSLVNRDDLLQVEGDLGIQVEDLVRDLAAEESARIAADNLKVDKEGSVSSVVGRVGDVVLAPSDVLVEGFGSQEDVNKYVPKPFLSGYTYGLGEFVVLNDGEVVKSLVDGNMGNPNVDMTGWVSAVSDSLSDTIQTFNTPEAGVDPVTGVVVGAYFNVRTTDDESYVDEYQNVGGSAVVTGKRYLSALGVQLQEKAASTIKDASGKSQQEVNNLQAEINRSKPVSVFDFMTMAQYKQWKDNQSTYNVTFALQAAIDAPDVFEVLLPQGTYLHSGLVCDKNNFRFYSNGYARSILLSDNTPHVAIHVAKNVVGISGFFLDGVKLQGNVNTLRGIQLGDAAKYVQFCNLNNCMIDGFTKSDACDIYLGSVQELDIVNTMSWRGNIGIYRPTGGYGTSIKISGKAGYLGRHAKHGIKLDGQIDDIYVQDNVIEGNGLEAIYISDTAFKNTQGVTIHLQNTYFEANGNSGAGAGVVFVKGVPEYLKFHRVYSHACNFADNPNAPVGFKNFAGEYTMLSVSDSSNLLPGQIGVTNSYITYHNNLTVSSGDITQQLKDLAALTGNHLTASGFNFMISRSSSPSKNIQTNFYSSIIFPTTAVLSTDSTALDDYREVEFTPIVTGHGGTVSVAVGKYTKIGNLVNFVIQLTTQNFTSTQGVTKISLPHTQIIGSVAQYINNQSYSGGVAVVATQSVNLPTLAAQGSVATIYITGQYMTAQ